MRFKLLLIFSVNILLLSVLNFGQQRLSAVLPKDEFEQIIIGDTLFYTEAGWHTEKGKANDKVEMKKIVTQLSANYNNITKKEGKKYDSLKAVIFQRMAYCYWAMTLFDSTIDYKSKIISSHRNALPFARRARAVSLTSRSYAELLFYNSSIGENIALLNEWIKDYNLWMKKTGVASGVESPYNRLAFIYTLAGNDEKELQTLKDWLNNTITQSDKILAYSEIVRYYRNHELWLEVKDFATQALQVQVKKNSLSEQQALAMAFLNSSLVESKLELKDFSNIPVYIDQSDPSVYCADPDYFSRFTYWRSHKDYLTAKYYLGLKEPSKALFYLQKIIYHDVDKMYYDYYKQIGDSAKAIVYLEQYTARKDTAHKRELLKIQKNSSENLELLKGYETRFIKEEAAKTKLLQEQEVITLQKQNEIDKIKSKSEKQTLLAAAENAELKRKIETEKMQSDASKTKQEQEYKVSLLNKDIKAKNRTKIILITGLAFLILFAGLLFFQNKQKQKANSLLVLQKNEIEQQRDKITKAMSELKAAQSQLVQSEKMASLGELTAGIAHEIQNPLNFVNNFSEVNKELADELKAELATGNMQSANDIANDIKDNSEKINHHGKRAADIVKGMLQHSRNSSGQKELTDINALCDEYFRLAYHGLRAKDKTFNANFETSFDNSIEKINVVPQDIGRVILNLINNAFYAVSERLRQAQPDSHYEPTVIVTTKKLYNNISIIVKDNGNGIPDSIKEKIFQPFFTTKPTGQGTGLGLSLSYDIVKAHGGEIRVETLSAEAAGKKGEGTTFTIQLPIIHT